MGVITKSAPVSQRADIAFKGEALLGNWRDVLNLLTHKFPVNKAMSHTPCIVIKAFDADTGVAIYRLIGIASRVIPKPV